MPFLQGLIQRAGTTAAATPTATRVLLERAWSRLGDAPEGYMGLDLSAWRAARPGLAEAFARWEAGAPRPDVAPPPVRAAPVG